MQKVPMRPEARRALHIDILGAQCGAAVDTLCRLLLQSAFPNLIKPSNEPRLGYAVVFRVGVIHLKSCSPPDRFLRLRNRRAYTSKRSIYSRCKVYVDAVTAAVPVTIELFNYTLAIYLKKSSFSAEITPALKSSMRL